MTTRGVYAIYDRTHRAGDCLDAVEAVVGAGACWLQYRDKRRHGPDPDLATALRDLARAAGAKLIVNDDWQLAHAIGADGVHLGRGDPTITRARSALGPHALIGASCSADTEHGARALADGADYLSFGRFFASTTKPDAPAAPLDVLHQARARFNVPIVAIGGIAPDNAQAVIDAGADLIALAGAIFDAADPGVVTRDLTNLFNQGAYQ